MSRQFYTYIYHDPKFKDAIYVGKGHNFRWKQHHNQTLRTPIANVVKKRLAEGYSMMPCVIEMPTEQEALQLEIFFIQFYGRADLGKGTLFNKTDGGEGWCRLPEPLPKIKTKKIKIKEKRKTNYPTAAERRALIREHHVRNWT